MSNFHPIIIRDEKIQDITTDLPIELRKGAKQNTFKRMNSDSRTTSNISFTIPTVKATVIDRTIKVKTKFELTINVQAGVPVGERCFQYGVTEALSAFPLNSMINNANLTVNYQSLTVDTQNIMGPLLKMHDQEEFSEFNCPTMIDQKMAKFSDMTLTGTDPLASYTASKSVNPPRGAHPLDSFTITRRTNGVANLVATQVSDDQDITDACTSSSQANDTWVIVLGVTTTEPLLFLSPLIYGKTSNNAGFHGIQAMSLDLLLDTSAKRAFSSATGVGMTIALTEVFSSELLLNVLTVQDSDIIAPKTVLPYTSYNRYITKIPNNILANTGTTIGSNSINISSIPNKKYICIRKQLSVQTMKDTDSFVPITGVSVTFNNLTSILNTATPEDLYKLSRNNGSKQLINEFLGTASIPNGKVKPTIGTIVVLDPALDFGLEEYLTSGSTGTYNFQIDVTYHNTLGETVVSPELLIITQSDGLFITENERSTVQTAIFTKTDVAKASVAQFGESRSYMRQFGSGPSVMNVPLLNADKSDITSGSGVRSGGGKSVGDYARQARAHLVSGL